MFTKWQFIASKQTEFEIFLLFGKSCGESGVLAQIVSDDDLLEEPADMPE